MSPTMRMESSVDENWDGSTYDGSTRAVITDATSISTIAPIRTDEDIDCYSLDGMKILQPKRGINIVRSKKGKVVKVINKK